jgi:hypothetical protein
MSAVLIVVTWKQRLKQVLGRCHIHTNSRFSARVTLSSSSFDVRDTMCRVSVRHVKQRLHRQLNTRRDVLHDISVS